MTKGQVGYYTRMCSIVLKSSCMNIVTCSVNQWLWNYLESSHLSSTNAWNTIVLHKNTLSFTTPPKLTQRIFQLEYIEMSDLIPKAWGLELENMLPCCVQGCCLTCRDQLFMYYYALTWVLQFFGGCPAMIINGHFGDFMAYQRPIIKASKSIECTAWTIYGHCYYRQ